MRTAQAADASYSTEIPAPDRSARGRSNIRGGGFASRLAAAVARAFSSRQRPALRDHFAQAVDVANGDFVSPGRDGDAGRGEGVQYGHRQIGADGGALGNITDKCVQRESDICGGEFVER